MKLFSLLLVSVLWVGIGVSEADENHEILEKVMKEGLKGDDKPLKKVLEGRASDDELKKLVELVGMMKGTKAPKGDQKSYDKLVHEFIEATNKVGAGDKSPEALKALKDTSNCKQCHNPHKPD